MPAIPNRYAKMGPKNEPAVQIRDNAGAVQGQEPRKSEKNIFKAPSMGAEELSLVRFDVAPEKIFTQLFGKDISVDEYTGVTTVPGITRAV